MHAYNYSTDTADLKVGGEGAKLHGGSQLRVAVDIVKDALVVGKLALALGLCKRKGRGGESKPWD